MSGVELPMWAAVPAALLLIASGLLTAIGSLGLLRLPSFQARMHGPSMGATLGCGCMLFASMFVSSAIAGRPVLHEFLITVFVVMTAPATAMLLMRASIYRARNKAGSAGGEVVQR
ncbi:MAG TPA: monovalent cation/H(+) antiporter subunit G [Steroidobacteraceae bacterium]|jgi:multicomponent K+:H+ antiporter subunit G|nr:monovalent cation/H(+) antiporter subunit G [Steroidobacteraceae bacterium]HNS27349.1 monovalent cation/H(+) antiporter subunit G [Steroidobacteraceae bacterium]